MTQDFKDANISLRLNYSYDKRYSAELTLAVMGSNKFDKTIVFFSGCRASWIISNEKFHERSKGC